jgi:HlyD family secretion protein
MFTARRQSIENMILKRPSFYLALLGIVGIVLMIKQLQHQDPAPPPVAKPTRSPFPRAIAATGIIEATRENVRIATTKPGLVTKVFVEVGSKVTTGTPLFQLDDREARARLASTKAQLDVLKATLAAENVRLRDLEDQLQRTIRLAKEQVSPEEELVRRRFAVEQSQAQIKTVEANIRATEQQIAQAETELEVLTVRSPRDGTVLQVNVREGEFANIQPSEPLMIIGDVNTLQIRADVDEQNAPLVQPNQPAVAYMKGDTRNPIELQFVRIDPFVVPKRSLTGDSAERVDTRVLQIIFAMQQPKVPAYVGQQVDVYIKAPETNGQK